MNERQDTIEAQYSFLQLVDAIGSSLVCELLQEAKEVINQGNEGVVLSDACEGELPTFEMAIRESQIDFRTGGNGHQLSLGLAQELLLQFPDKTR